jgi:uncharacterized protein (TIGR03437 family)
MSKGVYQVFKGTANAKAIPPADLVVRSGFAVFTNGGNTAGARITANSGGIITLEFVTFGVTPAGPQVDSILNNSSFIPDDTPSSGIAPSSIFVVKGQSLADPGDPVLQSSADPGLPLTLNGASLTVAVNGTTVHPALYYTSPTQLAGVLPANTPVGSGVLTVDYRGATSPAFPIQVVAHAPGINTYYANTGVATDAGSGALLTFTNAATPGETITLWTTGLGANPAASDTTFTAGAHDVDTPVQVYLGGLAANVLYGGTAGYPGVSQINLTIPDAVPTGCWVSMAVVAGGIISNVATLPIHAGGGACLDEATGLAGNQIAPGGGQTIRGGTVTILKTNDPTGKGDRQISYVADAAFEKYTGVYQPPYSLSPGGCLVKYPDQTVPIPAITGLDPGSISLTGPGGLSVKLSVLGNKGSLYALLPANAIPDSGGTFTFTGMGGADVGPFTSTITLNPLLTWTNPSVVASVDRSQGVTVKWSGGNPGSLVYITGASGVGERQISVGFTCLARADDGQFTIPPHILLALPPGKGSIGLQNQVSVPLPASGLDVAGAIADVEFSEDGMFN